MVGQDVVKEMIDVRDLKYWMSCNVEVPRCEEKPYLQQSEALGRSEARYVKSAPCTKLEFIAS